MNLIPIFLPVFAICAGVPGAPSLLRPGSVLLLGEIHGTVESPAVVSTLTCLALERGLAVTVGLEIPVSEAPRVALYLKDGEAQPLLSGPFWKRDYQDGRSSAAMFDLLSHLRELGSEAEDSLDVVLIDDPEAEGGRDRFMAARVAERAAETPQGVVIVLVGNLHNRLTRGTRFDSGYEPMGFLLRSELEGREIQSLRVTHGGGSAWVCTGSAVSDCGARELGGREATPGIELRPETSGEPYTGSYHLPFITASPPAREARPR